jgi:hypothetical protein
MSLLKHAFFIIRQATATNTSHNTGILAYCMKFSSNIIYTEMSFYECNFIFLHKKNSNEYAFNKYNLIVKFPVTNHLFYNEKNPHSENK